MNRKGFFRSISLILVVAFLVTSMPQEGYAKTVSVDDASAVTWAKSADDVSVTSLEGCESETESITDETGTDADSEKKAIESAKENTLEDSIKSEEMPDPFEETIELTEEEAVELTEEENAESLEEETDFEESVMAAEGGILTISNATESVSNPEKCSM